MRRASSGELAVEKATTRSALELSATNKSRVVNAAGFAAFFEDQFDAVNLFIAAGRMIGIYSAAEGYTQAAWWNRIPFEAWGLIAVIAICCNLLVGYGARRRSGRHPEVCSPIVLSISFSSLVLNRAS